jgi:preprotein translocase subunit SecA
MDHLKKGMGLRAYKQQDPVQAYQFEGSEMFDQMVQSINNDTIKYLMHVRVRKEEEIEREQVAVETKTNYDDSLAKEPVKKGTKVGRNDPCPCGSGKKFKNCHGKDAK